MSRYISGDGTLGLPEFAPYDAILVAAAAPSVPAPCSRSLPMAAGWWCPSVELRIKILRLIDRNQDTFRTHARALPVRSALGSTRLEGILGVMSPAPPELSIVIPAFNEELRLPETLSRISSYVRASKRESEVIVVDDGSTDRTADVANSFRGEIHGLRVVANRQNRGRAIAFVMG